MKRIISILFFAVIQLAAYGQISVFLNINYEPDPDVLSWAANPSTLQLTIINSSNQTIEYKVIGNLSLNGQTILDIDPTKMPIEFLGPNETKTAFAEDVFPEIAVKLYGNVKETYAKTNAIPGGQYAICVKIIDLMGKALSRDNCKAFQITSYQQPSLIYPTSSSTVAAITPPVFSWSPVVPMPSSGVVYKLRVVEVPENLISRHWTEADERIHADGKKWSDRRTPIGDLVQDCTAEYEAATGIEIFYREDRKITGVWKNKMNIKGGTPKKDFSDRMRSSQLSTEALRALNYGFPIIEEELNGLTQFLWPPDVQGPIAGRTYVWQVQALSVDNGKPIGDNIGLSQPAQFYVSEDARNGENMAQNLKAPEFIVADENGCLYGCTGNIWEPIDCPGKAFSSQSTYPNEFTLEGNCGKKITKGAKPWVLVEDMKGLQTPGTINTATNRVAEPMLPLSSFKLTKIDSPAKINAINPTATRIQTGGKDGHWDCWKVCDNSDCTKSHLHCIWVKDKDSKKIVSNDKTENVVKLNVQIIPNSIQNKNAIPKLPVITGEQLQNLIGNPNDFKTPVFGDLKSDGTINKVNSISDCTGIYSLSVTNETDSVLEGEPTTRQIVCYVSENPNGMFPVILCFNLCNLKPNENTITPVDETDNFPCINLELGAVEPDILNGAIAIRLSDGNSLCINTNGTCRPCNGKLPSKSEIEKAIDKTEESNTSKSRESCGRISCEYCYGPSGKIASTAGLGIDKDNHEHSAGYNPSCVLCQKAAWRPLRIPDGHYKACEHKKGDWDITTDCALCKEGEKCIDVTVSNYGAVPPPNPNQIKTKEPAAHVPPALDITKLNSALKGFTSAEKIFFISQSPSGDMKRIVNAKDCPKSSFLIQIELNVEELIESNDEWTEVDILRIYYCFTQNDGVLLMKNCTECYTKEGLCYKLKSSSYHNPLSRIIIAKENCRMCCAKPPDCLDHDPVKPCVEVPPIPSQPRITTEMFKSINFADSEDKLIFFSQHPTTGELTKIEKVEECPEGSFLLCFEIGDNSSTTRTMGDPLQGVDIKLGRCPKCHLMKDCKCKK